MNIAVRTTLAFSLTCAAFAVACGGSSEIAGDRDPLIGKGEGSGGNASSDDPNTPVTNDGSSGGTVVTPDPLPDTPACKQGFVRNAPGKKCDFVVKGTCFDGSDVACACAGCTTDKCLILESYPAQIHCQQ